MNYLIKSNDAQRLKLLNKVYEKTSMELLKKFIHVNKPCKILSLGCGTCDLEDKIANMYPNVMIDGIDMVKYEEHKKIKNDRVKVKNANVTSYDYSSYGIIYSRLCLSHIHKSECDALLSILEKNANY